MIRYILRRLVFGVFVLLGVVIATFILTRVVPSNPAAKWAGPRATIEQIRAAEVELGLDKPLYVQLGRYLKGLLKGDLGYSYRTHRAVRDELLEAIPATLELVLTATILAVIIGVTLGLYSAKYKNRLADHTVRVLSISAVSLPSFWFALAMQLLFYRVLGILPLGGRVSMNIAVMYGTPKVTGLLLLDCLLTGNFFIFLDALKHMILPALTIALLPIGMVARMTRSALLEIMNEDYITAARSYGIKEGYVLWVYALKNSLGPTATIIALGIGYSMVNTFLVESIFSWPGIGKYVAGAVLNLDYPAIMGVTIFSAILYLFLNLVADLIIALDPRIRV